MKYDLHCHSKEGSLDARLGIIPYAVMLKAKGYSGMLVTDHDSYKGYRFYQMMKECNKLPAVLKDFVVLKGIEYDTDDAGHVLVILPDGADCPILEKRGLKLEVLEKIVHGQGGIMGAAHPYGNGYIAITNTRLYKKNPDIIHCFDFIEAYNSTISNANNTRAYELAEEYHKPMTSGSDAHSMVRVGTAYTQFEEKLTCNNELIDYIRSGRATNPVGIFYPELLKKKNEFIRRLGIVSYWSYNKMGKLFRTGARHRCLQRMNYIKISTMN